MALLKINIKALIITGVTVVSMFLIMYGITSRSGFTFSSGFAFTIGTVIYLMLTVEN